MTFSAHISKKWFPQKMLFCRTWLLNCVLDSCRAKEMVGQHKIWIQILIPLWFGNLQLFIDRTIYFYDTSVLLISRLRKAPTKKAGCFFCFFFLFGFYGPFKNISLISSRSFIEGGRKPENPEKNHLTICKQNLAFPHMTQARLEPQRWET